MNGLLRVMRGLSTGLAWISAGLIGVVMVLTASDALGRYFFNHPLAGTLEVSESSIVIVIFLMIAYCQFHGGHIQVGFLINKFPARFQAAVAYVTNILAIVYFGLLSWRSGLVALHAFQIRETSWGSYPLPLYPAKFAVSVGSGAMCLYLIIEFVILKFDRAKKTTPLR